MIKVKNTEGEILTDPTYSYYDLQFGRGSKQVGYAEYTAILFLNSDTEGGEGNFLIDCRLILNKI